MASLPTYTLQNYRTLTIPRLYRLLQYSTYIHYYPVVFLGLPTCNGSFWTIHLLAFEPLPNYLWQPEYHIVQPLGLNTGFFTVENSIRTLLRAVFQVLDGISIRVVGSFTSTDDRKALPPYPAGRYVCAYTTTNHTAAIPTHLPVTFIRGIRPLQHYANVGLPTRVETYVVDVASNNGACARWARHALAPADHRPQPSHRITL